MQRNHKAGIAATITVLFTILIQGSVTLHKHKVDPSRVDHAIDRWLNELQPHLRRTSTN
jgi:hypothetical protein